jgi:lysophospholipase L1-like esterase
MLRTVAWVLVLAASVGCGAQSGTGSERWVASWATSVQGPEPENNQPPIDAALLTDATVRQIVHLSMGGAVIRVHLSNAFGRRPLVVDSVHVAMAVATDSSAIVDGSDRPVMFDGKSSVTIPIGAEYLSDPIALNVTALSNVAISLHLAEPPMEQTGHTGSRATSYFVHGDHSADKELVGAEKIDRWVLIEAVDVTAAKRARTVVAFGDSITDGHATTTNGNDRWTDVLAQRLQADKKTRDVGVANEGIGGNHLLTNGLGENALERFDRDVLAVSGVRYVIVLEGINDLGALTRTAGATADQHTELVARMEGALAQIVARAHAHGILVYGATIMPDGGGKYYNPNDADNAARLAVNAWILTPGHFDAVVDLDKVTRDPADPMRLNPAFDSGDHLHPGPAGYKAMGEAIPLDWFK